MNEVSEAVADALKAIEANGATLSREAYVDYLAILIDEVASMHAAAESFI